jgi:predicted secreted protein
MGINMRKLTIILFFMSFIALLGASDVPEIADLGFSSDGKYCMFGYYGVDSETAKAYAELFIVELKSNEFVSDGVFSYKSPASVSPGFSALGALLNLYDQSAGARKKYKIEPLTQGRLVYVLLNGAVPETSVEFRDFQGKTKYRISLEKAIVGSGKTVKSSFSLVVKKTGENGSVADLKGGNPAVKRAEVEDYQIKKIILSPDEKYMVVLIAKHYAAEAGGNIRYMIETIAVK